MKNKPFESNFRSLPELLPESLLCFSLVYALTSSLMLIYPITNLAFLTFFFMLIWHVVHINKYTRIITEAAAIISSAVFLLQALKSYKLSGIFAYITEYYYQLSDLAITGRGDLFPYAGLTSILLCAAFSFFIYVSSFRFKRFLPVLIAGTSVFVVQWINAYTASLIPFFIFLPSILLLYLRSINKKLVNKEGGKYLSQSALVLWTTPLIALILGIVLLSNFNFKPMEWKWLDSKINSVWNYAYAKYNYSVFDTFSVSSSGFGYSNGVLGGRIKPDRTLVMEVETPVRVYLRGAIRDYYTGHSWENSNDTSYQTGEGYIFAMGDAVQLLNASTISDFNSLCRQPELIRNEVKIRYVKLKTRTIFTIPGFCDIEYKGSIPSASLDTNGSVSVASPVGPGFSYTMNTILPDYTQTKILITASISSASPFSSSFYTTNNSSELKIYSEPLPEEALYGIVDAVLPYSSESRYLQLPAGLPQRVRDLALEITKGYDNDIDKATAIEQFLAKTYIYNISVGRTPHRSDFVDYFLFDLREGYCTYYASAMVVLARCAGLQARYAEGYMLPAKPVSTDSDKYLVTNLQAHAWAEIYRPGFGWVVYEPTSPFTDAFHESSEIEAKVDVNSSSDEGLQDYYNMLENYSQLQIVPSVPVPEKLSGPRPIQFVLLFLAVVFLIIIIILLSNLLRIKRRYRSISRLPARESVKHSYSWYLGILSILQPDIQPGESPSEFAARIDRNLVFKFSDRQIEENRFAGEKTIPVTKTIPEKKIISESKSFSCINRIFEDSRYGLDEIEENKKQAVLDFLPVLTSLARERLGSLRFFIYRYFLGRF